jgi:serine/threonine protein kinase
MTTAQALLMQIFAMFSELGPYRVLKERERCHNAVTYEAFDQIHRRKVVLAECPNNLPVEEIIQRLEDHGRVFTLLNHPNIARVFGFVRREDRIYLATEWVERTTLQQILHRRGTMSLEMTIVLFRQIMTGMAFAHRLGVTHGDLKPNNIAVPDFGPIKILGLAFQHAFRPESLTVEDGNSRYLSPEQLQGRQPDRRSDVYALGLMLYEAVVRKTPFDAYGSSAAAAQAEFIPMAPSLLRHDLPRWLDDLLLKMIAPDPQGRFQSMEPIIRFLDSRSSVERMRKQKEWINKKELVIERGSRLNGLFRVALRTAETTIVPRLHGFMGLFEGGSATCVLRVRNLSANCLKAGTKLRTATAGSLHSMSSRIPVGTAGLLALILLATLYFRGTHISLLTVPGMQTGASLNDSVDAMYARLKRESNSPVGEPSQPQEHSVPPPARRTNKLDQTNAVHNLPEGSPKERVTLVDKTYQVKQRAIVPPREVPENRFLPTKPQGETVLSKAERSPPRLESAQALSRSESDMSEAVRTTQNSAPNRQLNVKWDN